VAAVSPKTGYKWIDRYERQGPAGLPEHSRAPPRCARRIAAAIAGANMERRRQHPRWRPRKLLAWFAQRQPELELPRVSTAADLEASGSPGLVTQAPNEV
jgi:Homeodomain-like domain